MTVTVYPSPPETSRWVDKNRFLIGLHTFRQRRRMLAARSRANTLTDAQLESDDLTETTADGTLVVHLVVIKDAEEQMNTLSRVDLLSSQIDAYFNAAKVLGIYGADGDEADAEIARIKSNTAVG